MISLLRTALLISASSLLSAQIAAAQAGCTAAYQTALEQNYQTKNDGCLNSQASEGEATVHLQSLRNERSTLFGGAVKTFGNKCVSSLLATKKSTKGCKGRAAAKAASSIRNLKQLDASITAAAAGLTSIWKSRTRLCAEKEAAATALADYLYNCPPANPNPPPDSEFRPDLSNFLFCHVDGSEAPLPAATWLMSKWDYYNFGELYRFNFKTNGTYEIIFVYRCSLNYCYIKEASGIERGTYSFDGVNLRLTGAHSIAYTHSDGSVVNETRSVTSAHTVSLVVLEELILGSGSPRLKLGLELSGGVVLHSGDSDQMYYLERSDW